MAALTARGGRIHRCVWLYSKLHDRGRVDFPSYQRHFHAARSSYYRDLDVLRGIGLGIESIRDHGTVRLVRESL